MRGFVIGIACGALELFLLSRLVRAASNQNLGVMALALFLKIAVLACAFVPVVLFFRNDLLWCGIGIAFVLIFGSAAIFIKRTYKKGGNRD